jgi:hypothetical protein
LIGGKPSERAGKRGARLHKTCGGGLQSSAVAPLVGAPGCQIDAVMTRHEQPDHGNPIGPDQDNAGVERAPVEYLREQGSAIRCDANIELHSAYSKVVTVTARSFAAQELPWGIFMKNINGESFEIRLNEDNAAVFFKNATGGAPRTPANRLFRTSALEIRQPERDVLVPLSGKFHRSDLHFGIFEPLFDAICVPKQAHF